jgi:hypothetical protein
VFVEALFFPVENKSILTAKEAETERSLRFQDEVFGVCFIEC